MKPFTRIFDRLRSPSKPAPQPARAPEPPPKPVPLPAAPATVHATPAEARLPDSAPHPAPAAKAAPALTLQAATMPAATIPAATMPAATLAWPEAPTTGPAGIPAAAALAVPAARIGQAPVARAATPAVGAVDWKVISPTTPASARKQQRTAWAGVTLSSAMRDVAASSLAAGMMAASGRRHSAGDAIALLDQVREAMQPRRTPARKR